MFQSCKGAVGMALVPVALGGAFQQGCEASEGRESRRAILCLVRRRLTGRGCHLIPLVFIVVTIEAK